NPTIISLSSCTRAIVPGEARARSRTSRRQVSSQKPGTDFISNRIPAISEALARRITSTSLADELVVIQQYLARLDGQNAATGVGLVMSDGTREPWTAAPVNCSR